MAVMILARAFSVKVGSAGKKLVLLKLADNANDKGECWPSYQHIADQCEISRRSAMNYIDALIKDGLIEKQTRKGPKGNSTNVYVVTLGGERDSLGGGENHALGGERAALDGEAAAPRGGESAAPGISHSFESVSESVTKNTGSADAKPASGSSSTKRFSDEDFESFWTYCRTHWFGKPGHKAEARKEFGKLRPDRDDLREILRLTRHECDFRRRTEANEGFCENMKHVCRWLKVRGWEDVRERMESGPSLALVQSKDPAQANQPYRAAMPKPDQIRRKSTGTGGDA